MSQSTENTHKLCVDCKHIATNASRDWEKYRCFAPQNESGVNLVTGEKKYKYLYCKDAREVSCNPETDKCGIEGKWFEQKEIQQSVYIEDTDQLKPPKDDRLKNLKKKLSNITVADL